mmetsp:Transcript_19489/g.24067  ORF Transcript_19489/g.24067 Transcript_19489/m.24067 type:complete len:142 (+) Transcript_19489:2-427(+)
MDFVTYIKVKLSENGKSGFVVLRQTSLQTKSFYETECDQLISLYKANKDQYMDNLSKYVITENHGYGYFDYECRNTINLLPSKNTEINLIAPTTYDSILDNDNVYVWFWGPKSMKNSKDKSRWHCWFNVNETSIPIKPKII